MDNQEIIALVFPEDGDTVRTATVVLRDATGTMTVRQVASDDALLSSDASLRFRKGAPILDPRSREVMGYELEPRSATG